MLLVKPLFILLKGCGKKPHGHGHGHSESEEPLLVTKVLNK